MGELGQSVVHVVGIIPHHVEPEPPCHEDGALVVPALRNHDEPVEPEALSHVFHGEQRAVSLPVGHDDTVGNALCAKVTPHQCRLVVARPSCPTDDDPVEFVLYIEFGGGPDAGPIEQVGTAVAAHGTRAEHHGHGA